MEGEVILRKCSAPGVTRAHGYATATGSRRGATTSVGSKPKEKYAVVLLNTQQVGTYPFYLVCLILKEGILKRNSKIL